MIQERMFMPVAPGKKRVEKRLEPKVKMQRIMLKITGTLYENLRSGFLESFSTYNALKRTINNINAYKEIKVTLYEISEAAANSEYERPSKISLLSVAYIASDNSDVYES